MSSHAVLPVRPLIARFLPVSPFLSTLATFLIGCCLSFLIGYTTTATAEPHHDHETTQKYTVTEVRHNISMLQGKGGNIAVLSGPDGLLMVDNDYEVMSKTLEESLQHFGGANKLKYIINTHWHGDHTEGNKLLGKYAPIVAHDNVRKRLMTRQEVKLFNMIQEPYTSPALPTVTYDKSMSLYINGEKVHIIHLPGGHTDGDSIVYFEKANVLHLGDHFFNGMFPFVDVNSGGNVKRMAQNLKSIMPMINNGTLIIPGHGPLAKQGELEGFVNMLLGTYHEVASLKRSGLSMEESQKKGLSNKWQPWAEGFLDTATWIGIVYSSL